MIKKRTIKGIEFEIGTGNVYEDLGFPNADELLLKSQLALAIQKEIEKLKISQAEAGNRIGIAQSDVSRLLAGKLDAFSIERLLSFINRLGYSVEMKLIRETRKKRQPHTYVNMAA